MAILIWLRDDLHLSSAGYEVLYQKLTELIIATYPELDPETMTQRIPS